MLPRNILHSKIFWKIPGRRKGPLQGIVVEMLPRSLFRFRFTYRATNGIRRCPAYKTSPWHRIPPKPPRHFSESEPRIWLWGRVSGEDRFDHSARVDAVLVKAYCIALHQDPSWITTILYREDADWPALPPAVWSAYCYFDALLLFSHLMICRTGPRLNSRHFHAETFDLKFLIGMQIGFASMWNDPSINIAAVF